MRQGSLVGVWERRDAHPKPCGNAISEKSARIQGAHAGAPARTPTQMPRGYVLLTGVRNFSPIDLNFHLCSKLNHAVWRDLKLVSSL